MDRLLNVLRWVALGALAVVVLIQAQHYRLQATVNGQLTGLLEPGLRAERWLGQNVPDELMTLVDAPDRPARRPVLIWVLDLDTCRECTFDLHHWNSMAGSSELRSVLVLSSHDHDLVKSFRELISPELPVITVTPGTISQWFSFEFSSIRLLAEDAGEIVSVSARRPNVSCQWSYVAYVTRMMGIDAGLPLRLAPGT